MTMELILENGNTWQNPSREEIRNALDTVGKSDDNCFAVLSRQADFYIQASGSRARGFIVEYRDGSEDRHFSSLRSDIPHHKMAELFLSYFDGDDRWKQAVKWCCNTPNVQKPKPPRYLRNGVILVVVGTLLLLSALLQYRNTAELDAHLGEATGTILEIHYYHLSKNPFARADALVRFQADGREYTVENSLSLPLSSHRVGGHVRVFYDKRDPLAYARFLESPAEIWRKFVFLSITGVLLAIAGAVYLFHAKRADRTV